MLYQWYSCSTFNKTKTCTDNMSRWYSLETRTHIKRHKNAYPGWSKPVESRRDQTSLPAYVAVTNHPHLTVTPPTT